jgi:hypothetical protein
MMTLTKHSDAILGPVPRICNVLILSACLDPWDKPKDGVENGGTFVTKPERNLPNRHSPFSRKSPTVSKHYQTTVTL